MRHPAPLAACACLAALFTLGRQPVLGQARRGAPSVPTGARTGADAFLSPAQSLRLLSLLEGAQRPRPPFAPTELPDWIDGLRAFPFPRGLVLLERALDGTRRIAALLLELRQLAIALANRTLSPAERAALEREYRGTQLRLALVAWQTRFEGRALLSGGPDVYLYLPPPGAETLRVDLPDLRVSTLGVSLVPMSMSLAQAALDLLDTAVAEVTQARAELELERARLLDGPPDSGLIELQGLLARMRTLADTARDGRLNTGERVPLDRSYQSDLERYDATVAATRLGRMDLLVGGVVGLQGAAPGETRLFFVLPDAGARRPRGDVRTATSAQLELEALDAALAFVAEQRARIQATRQVLARADLHVR